ncbi:polysialyltransferase family glycosyltransferase [Jatrophihabitans sp.]|uniref:polysialyltransferase family glycosyltransferase n=1 Tax=Jatrophihabitans sp. TaxID=1932789 RepID=UPI0030C682C4|nr:hypothetical protein [Jatrophihabitans sp.]
MTTRVFYASTLFGAMGLAAAIEAGQFGDRVERQLLIVSNNSAVPEVTYSFVDSAAFAPLRRHFDDIVHWNDLVAPLHPAGWVPSRAEMPMLSRLFAERLGLQDGVSELVLESIAVAPARSIGMLIADCPITVYSDGLMSYGPTRDSLPGEIGLRVTRLLYLDLLPGVTPLLLREYQVDAQAIPDGAFAKVVEQLPEPAVGELAGWPLILGQYLSQLGILTVEEELELHAEMLRSLAARGHRRIVFKPHPAAGRSHVLPLQREADLLGVELAVPADTLPAEAWFAAARPELVVSCFSTALLTAVRLFDIPAATVGGELVLERIVPYENSNRIPATIVDATVPQLRGDGTLADPPQRDIAQLLHAVGFCMQARRHPDLRSAAAAYLASQGRERYFKSRRLQRLGLVPAPRYRSAGVRRVVRRCRRLMARLGLGGPAKKPAPRR